MRRKLTIALGVAALITGGGCAHKKRARVEPAAPVAVSPGWTETGIASWYGHPYHGRAAANGEIYDMEKLTAAHRTLPFDTWVRVHDLENGKTVEVRINDRGPFVDGRVIDLSHAAARSIELIRPGTAKVRLEVIRPPAKQAAARFAVQVGVYRDRRSAERIRAGMESLFGPAQLVERDGRPVMWRVVVGSEPSEQAAAVLATRIREGHPEARAAFVVRLDL